MLTDEARRQAESLRGTYGYSPYKNMIAARTLERLAEEVEKLQVENAASKRVPLSPGLILQASPAWVEFKTENGRTYLEVCGISMTDAKTYRVRYIGITEYDDLPKKEYNKTWRVWPEKPTAKEIREAEWDE